MALDVLDADFMLFSMSMVYPSVKINRIFSKRRFMNVVAHRRLNLFPVHFSSQPRNVHDSLVERALEENGKEIPFRIV